MMIQLIFVFIFVAAASKQNAVDACFGGALTPSLLPSLPGSPTCGDGSNESPTCSEVGLYAAPPIVGNYYQPANLLRKQSGGEADSTHSESAQKSAALTSSRQNYNVLNHFLEQRNHQETPFDVKWDSQANHGEHGKQSQSQPQIHQDKYEQQQNIFNNASPIRLEFAPIPAASFNNFGLSLPPPLQLAQQQQQQVQSYQNIQKKQETVCNASVMPQYISPYPWPQFALNPVAQTQSFAQLQPNDLHAQPMNAQPLPVYNQLNPTLRNAQNEASKEWKTPGSATPSSFHYPVEASEYVLPYQNVQELLTTTPPNISGIMTTNTTTIQENKPIPTFTDAPNFNPKTTEAATNIFANYSNASSLTGKIRKIVAEHEPPTVILNPHTNVFTIHQALKPVVSSRAIYVNDIMTSLPVRNSQKTAPAILNEFKQAIKNKTVPDRDETVNPTKDIINSITQVQANKIQIEENGSQVKQIEEVRVEATTSTGLEKQQTQQNETQREEIESSTANSLLQKAFMATNNWSTVIAGRDFLETTSNTTEITTFATNTTEIATSTTNTTIITTEALIENATTAEPIFSTVTAKPIFSITTTIAATTSSVAKSVAATTHEDQKTKAHYYGLEVSGYDAYDSSSATHASVLSKNSHNAYGGQTDAYRYRIR